ncbi:his operon leader peptide [Xenorhabdus sp. SF857]|nr:his operon leader peptide [Xenorhabdus sp. SF857]WFQ81443.1 his operon leader peptide [Xenorhabdus sp. SF857]
MNRIQFNHRHHHHPD